LFLKEDIKLEEFSEQHHQIKIVIVSLLYVLAKSWAYFSWCNIFMMKLINFGKPALIWNAIVLVKLYSSACGFSRLPEVHRGNLTQSIMTYRILKTKSRDLHYNDCGRMIYTWNGSYCSGVFLKRNCQLSDN